ncbi:hypothetical protein KCU65_g5097, partial [Aureobasidium melanogenum]
MQLTTVALTLGLAATWGATAPVDAFTDPNGYFKDIHPIIPPVPYPIDLPLGIADLPQPVQDCLERKPAPKEGDPQQPPEHPPADVETTPHDGNKFIAGHRSEFDFNKLTVNTVCAHGSRKMSSAAPFHRFEKHVFGAIKRCPEVDMKPLEDLFWDVNHQCHKKWMHPSRPQSLFPPDAEEADAAEKDETLSDDE